MKNIKYLFLFIASVFLLNSCENDIAGTEDLNYITFESTAIDMGVTIDGSSEYEFLVYTTQVTGSDRTFNLKVDTEATTADAAAYDVPATVTVPANSNVGVIRIGLNDINIGDGKDLVLELEVEPGVFKGEATTITITQICLQNEVYINLLFDDWGSECSWELVDGADQVVASGSGYTDGQVSDSKKLCIPNGTYTFTVNDAYGDGGTDVSIVNNGTEIATIGGGDYTDTKTITLDISK